MWTLKISEQPARFYTKLNNKEQQRMAAAFDFLQQNPWTGKPLKGELKGYWSYRVGMYRIIYKIEESQLIIYVLRIHHRKEVYERFRR